MARAKPEPGSYPQVAREDEHDEVQPEDLNRPPPPIRRPFSRGAARTMGRPASREEIAEVEALRRPATWEEPPPRLPVSANLQRAREIIRLHRENRMRENMVPPIQPLPIPLLEGGNEPPQPVPAAPAAPVQQAPPAPPAPRWIRNEEREPPALERERRLAQQANLQRMERLRRRRQEEQRRREGWQVMDADAVARLLMNERQRMLESSQRNVRNLYRFLNLEGGILETRELTMLENCLSFLNDSVTESIHRQREGLPEEDWQL